MDTAQQHVSQLINGFWAAQVACAAAALSLPDHLAAGPMTAEALADAAGAHAPSVHRLLRALASLGLCAQEPDGRFRLTEAGEYLRADAPGSVRGRALFTGDMLWKQFGDLTQQVKTGGRTQHVVSGAEGFEILRNDPPRLHGFQQAMAESSTIAARDAMKVYDFRCFARVLDLGGGYGGVLAELLSAHPDQTGAVFDLDYLDAGARTYLEHAGVAGRARFIGGSFFEAVPGGFDLILMKFIIHDWGDEEAHAVLAQARATADADATLALLEQVVPETIAATPEHQAVIRGDLTMMGMGGKERTAEEYRALLAGAGWRLERIVPSGAAFSVIEGMPA
ncbi:MAG TPA: methyltransferase [Caulobacteraceae bacterium]|nr:methyltransferase [Caulobacteraceae bacterium]